MCGVGVMSMAGRETYLDDLDGPGGPILRSRIQRTAAGTSTDQSSG